MLSESELMNRVLRLYKFNIRRVMKNRTYLRIFLLTAFSLLITSCGVLYNFKAYFNSYYNAKVLFEQVETNILKQPKDLFSYYEIAIPAQDYTALVKVNEKCSKILQYDMRSSYFVDAVWLSGKAFYYQREYVKAERKFKELLTVESDPEKLVEVNLWLGKTELQLRNFDEGIKLLNQTASDAIKIERDDIFSEAVIKQIGFLIYKERFAEAIDRCNEFLKNSTNNERNAEVAFELGKFYYKNDDFEKASAAFKSVLTYSPAFETAYKSKLENAKCLMDMGKVDEGLSILTEMRNKSQYAQYLDEISVEIGTGYYYKKDFKYALEIYTNIDTLYYGMKSSGVAEYMKGQIYEYHLPDFDSALYYYSAADQNNNLSEEMKLQITKKANIFTKYIVARDDIKNNTRQITYAIDKKNYLRDSLFYVEAIYKDTTEMRKRMMAGQGGDRNQLAGGQTGFANQSGINQTGTNQTGFNQTGFNQTTQNQTNYSQQTTDYSQTNPQSAMGAQSSMYGSNQNLSTQTTGQTKLGLSGNQYNTTNNRRAVRTARKKPLPQKPQFSPLSKDSLRSILSTKLFAQANLFFTDLELPDSAAYLYKKLLTEFSDKKRITPNVLYALGTYYLTMEQKEKADSLFRIVNEKYKNSEAALAAAKKLGLIEDVPKSDPADASYIEAEKKYFDKKYDEAINDFRAIIAKHPKSKLAPKSAYYIAFIFENDIKNIDSTTAAYEYLIKKFPESEIMAKTMKRNSVYQEEKKRKEKPAEKKVDPAVPAAQPGLKNPVADASKAVPDSIKTAMQKAQLMEALKIKKQKEADSLKALKESIK